MPRISVIIPTYQHASTIGPCLDSVLAQTLKPFEIIVVNDGSTDGTEKVLETYRDHVTVISQVNCGSNPSRNTGWKASTGDFLIFCDADVIMQPNMLERLAGVLEEHPEASYAYGGFRFGWKAMPAAYFDSERLRKTNYIHTTALIRREHFPGFDEAIKRFQDWDVWLTMLEAGHVGVQLPGELFQIIDVAGRAGISQWVPSIVLKFPWKYVGWMPASVKKYQQAREVIAKKHHLA